MTSTRSRGSEQGDIRWRVNRHFVIGSIGKDHVADGRLHLALPFITGARGQHRITRSQQHHAATAIIDVARAAHLALATERSADLLQDVNQQPSLFRVNFGNASFEADFNFR